MSDFNTALREALGEIDDRTDISLIVRRCWHAAIPGLDLRVWEGQGKLFTADGNEWLGVIDGNGQSLAEFPNISDARDGSSIEHKVVLPYLDAETFKALKKDQTKVSGYALTCWLALIKPKEGLRPQTPIRFKAELTMQSTPFSEVPVIEGGSFIVRRTFTVIAKNANAGRSSVPDRDWSSTGQKEYASRLGVEDDQGCDFLALMANRTYRRP